jgi:iron(III) transport system substrate-binding protein
MGVFKTAPNPNAARLMVTWIMSAEGQSFLVKRSSQYPANKQVEPKPGRPLLSSIKTFEEDPVTVEKQADQIKAAQLRPVLQGIGCPIGSMT